MSNFLPKLTQIGTQIGLDWIE